MAEEIPAPACQNGCTKYSLFWKIQDVLKGKKNGQYHQSEDMACYNRTDTSFSLRLFPWGDEEATDEFISLHFQANPARDISKLRYVLKFKQQGNESITYLGGASDVKNGSFQLPDLVSRNMIFNQGEALSLDGVLSISMRLYVFKSPWSV